MEDLEKYEDCILDNKESLVIDIASSTVYYLDFINMTVRINDKKTLKPIRYINEYKNVRVWGTSSWLRFRGPRISGVITKLFDNYNERTLLGLNDEQSS